MDWGTLCVQNIITSISAAFIFVTLLAVFIQIRINNKVVRGQAYQSITNSANDFARFSMSNADLLEFFRSWSYNPSTMKNLTDEQARWAATMALDFWENLYYQQEQGMLPKPLWDHWKSNMEWSAKLPGFHSYWDPIKSHYYKKFTQFVDSIS